MYLSSQYLSIAIRSIHLTAIINIDTYEFSVYWRITNI